MSECYSTVMRESSLDQHVTVETSHLRNCKYTDSTEGTCCNRKNLAVCDICAKLVVRCTLQTIEGDIARLISPSRVPFVTSIGRDLAMII